MIGSNTIGIITTRAVYIAGTPYAEGARVRLPPAQAWEAVSDGYARLVDPDHADLARKAFIEQQHREMAKLNSAPVPPEWRESPWRPMR